MLRPEVAARIIHATGTVPARPVEAQLVRDEHHDGFLERTFDLTVDGRLIEGGAVLLAAVVADGYPDYLCVHPSVRPERWQEVADAVCLGAGWRETRPWTATFRDPDRLAAMHARLGKILPVTEKVNGHGPQSAHEPAPAAAARWQP